MKRIRMLGGAISSTLAPHRLFLFLGHALLSLLSDYGSGLFRSRFYRLLGIDVSPDAFLMGNVRFRGRTSGNLHRLHIGAGSRVSTDVAINCEDDIHIGVNVTIGPFTRIYTSTHALGYGSERCLPEVVTQPVVIENGCWLAVGVTVLPGVTIGHGSVISAGSVVATSIPPDSYAEGVPATVVRKLPFGNR